MLLQCQALADKFSQLEQEQGEVQRSLEQALMRERERGCGLEEELTNERGRSGQLGGECASLQDQLMEARAEVSRCGLSRWVWPELTPPTGKQCAWPTGGCGGPAEAGRGGEGEGRGGMPAPAPAAHGLPGPLRLPADHRHLSQ